MSVWELSHSVVADVARDVAWAWWTTVDDWRRHEGDAVESITLDGPSAEQYVADLEAGFAPNLGPGMEKIARAMAGERP